MKKLAVLGDPTICRFHYIFLCLVFQNQKSMTGCVTVFVRLCVAVKRKLQLYYWKNGSFLELQSDLVVSDVPRTISWSQDTLCIGYKGEYCLLSVCLIKFSFFSFLAEQTIISLLQLSTNQSQELFPVGRAPEPSITKLGGDVFALGKDTQCIFINKNGDPTLKYAVKWPEVPVALGNSLLAVV